MICPHCNFENEASSNFCGKCGTRLKRPCNCWVEKKVFDCGYDECPGFQLHYMKYSKKAQAYPSEVRNQNQ